MRGRAGVRAVVTGPWGRPRCVGRVGTAGGGGGTVCCRPACPCARVCTHSCARPRRVVSFAAGCSRSGGRSSGWGWTGLGTNRRPHLPSNRAAWPLHSREERPKQEEEGGAQARVLRELHADAGGGGAHREGAQSASGDLPRPLPAGQIHYGTAPRGHTFFCQACPSAPLPGPPPRPLHAHPASPSSPPPPPIKELSGSEGSRGQVCGGWWSQAEKGATRGRPSLSPVLPEQQLRTACLSGH